MDGEVEEELEGSDLIDHVMTPARAAFDQAKREFGQRHSRQILKRGVSEFK